MTSDAGLYLPRALDERLGLDALIERHLADPSTGRHRQFPLSDLFRQSVYSRLAGYEDTNDADRAPVPIPPAPSQEPIRASSRVPHPTPADPEVENGT